MHILCLLARNFFFVALASTLVISKPIYGLEQNRADIRLDSDLRQMNVIVGSPSSVSGCAAGQYWDIGQGRCTAEVLLRTVNVSESCSCSCPSGTSGSCSSTRSGSYGVFGWRLPTSGQERISYNGPTSWGACSVIANNCQAEVPTDSGTGPVSPGTVWQVTIYICNASSPAWNTGVANLNDSQKSRFVQTYRNFNIGARCPESFGYTGWQATWNLWANEIVEQLGISYENALEFTWTRLRSAMIEAAEINGENTPGFQSVMDSRCTDYARSTYGNPSLNAVYVMFSGDRCQII